MRSLYFLIFLLSFTANAICDFPHSPPAYCLDYELEGAFVKIEKYSPYSCEYTLKKHKYFRPANTFHFNKSLDKVIVSKASPVDLSNSARIKETNKIYSKTCQLPAKGKLLVHLNCYDDHDNIPDFQIVTQGLAKGKVFETRSQNYIDFNCE